MTVVELLREVRSHGANVEMEGDRLSVDMPSSFPDALIERLRQQKPEVMEHLRHQDVSSAIFIHVSRAFKELCPVCGYSEFKLRSDGRAWLCATCH